MEDFQVKLVAPSLWRPLVRDSFGDLSAREQRLAHSILTTMHNRHIGVTPELVAGLTPLLLDPSAQSGAMEAWATVLGRLISQLSIGTERISKGRSLLRGQGFGLLLNSIPPYSVIRLAMPIIEEACRQIHRCYLFCADEIAASVEDKAYSKYSEHLSQAIIDIARSNDDRLESFWDDRAFTLSSFSRQPAVFGRSSGPLPELDPTALGFLLRLEPDMPSSEQKAQPLRYSPKPFLRRKSQRRKEEGVEGIRITRREEDIDSMLLSELINPKIILVDRLINTGFLAFQRQTKRDKPRDVLIAALMPGDVRVQPSADFIKACWFDCLMRFSLMLRLHRLHRTEFRWIEGDSFGRTRTCAFLLQDVPVFKTYLERGPGNAYRREFLTRLRWLPSYLDTRGRFSPLPDGGTKEEVSQIKRDDGLTKWASAAWAAQQDHIQWISRQPDKTPQGPAPTSKLKTEEFAFVHLMLFLPTSKRNENLPTEFFNQERLHRSFDLSDYPGHNLSVTWVPDNPAIAVDWAYEARGGRIVHLFPVERPNISEQEIAGRLERTWLDQITKEMWRA